MDVSVILATFKRPQLLRKTLESFCALSTHGIDWEVIVVDNAGDITTNKIVNQFKNKLPVKYLIETTPGKNSALNKAIPEARGELFVFTDDDIIAHPLWLKEIIQGASRWPEIKIFGGTIKPFWPNIGGKILNGLKKMSPQLLCVMFAVTYEQCEHEVKPTAVLGPNMIVSRYLFDKGFKFNPEIGPNSTISKYIMGSETEFNERVARAGYKAVFLPRAVVYHQIRVDQISKNFLCRRAFMAGREQAFGLPNPKVSTIIGIPRYLFRMYLEGHLKYAFASIKKEPISSRLELLFHLWFIRGMIFQYYFMKKKSA